MIKSIKSVPILGSFLRRIYSKFRKAFPGSKDYWENRYATGGNSGAGSYGKFAEFKASVLNHFVVTNRINSVIEFGCGDGNQLTLANYPRYVGYDVSETAISKCKKIFSEDANKKFGLISEYNDEKSELTLSLDVIYHLVEDNVFENYMRILFGASDKFVIVYASNTDDNRGYEDTHVKHRKFTSWVHQNFPEWTLTEHMPNIYTYKGDYLNESFADFFIFTRV
jgi:SAM-dependent methyltransferase